MRSEALDLNFLIRPNSHNFGAVRNCFRQSVLNFGCWLGCAGCDGRGVWHWDTLGLLRSCRRETSKLRDNSAPAVAGRFRGVVFVLGDRCVSPALLVLSI